ncbi:tripartite tricarboxylate transporter TctB family protein [Arthrobacter sulfonylureivorans]|uniref:Tripartite tricarboxylate transporter TctB family protein n=1 Tax=Arthrobacter sulfonylureivorans TaxID=2486855 RepID=A0ABY3W5X8_9MICC|nr:tripartite tricarboxylate transporter TctB family protein [Arthrobacter sulfonylureivorans]UNK44827.1 tripartite tricarboxylate transporter TctB family protein [Arthrobacter sulfonylureivorans]
MVPSTTGAVRGGSDAAPVKPLGEIIFAAVILSIGIVGFVAGDGIQTPDSASDIGPRALPYLVSGLLVIVGAGLIVQLLRGKTGEADEGEDIDPDVRTDWLTVAKMAGTVVVHIFLIIPLGWPVAAAVLFFGAAWALGAKPLWRAAVVGVVMALVLQFAFGGLLGVSLPAGVLEGVPFLNG